MLGVKNFLDGKKANISAGWMFAGAVALLMNGAMVNTETGEIILQNGDGEMAALLTAISVALATQRAAISKLMKAVQAAGVPLLMFGAMALYMVGCASLGNTNPNTGNTFGADIQGEIINLAPLFGPGLSAIIPLLTGTALNLATIIGQALESNTSPPTPPGPTN